MEPTEYTRYDKMEFYEQNIKPRVTEIKKLCKVNNIPFVFACAPFNDSVINNKTKRKSDQTKYIYDGVLTGSCRLNLFEDRFENFLLAICGAKYEPLAELQMTEEMQDYISIPPQVGNEEETNIQTISKKDYEVANLEILDELDDTGIEGLPGVVKNDIQNAPIIPNEDLSRYSKEQKRMMEEYIGSEEEKTDKLQGFERNYEILGDF